MQIVWNRSSQILILLSNIDHGNLNTIRQPIDVDMHILAPVRKRLERYKSKELEFVTEISEQGKITAPRREFSPCGGALDG